MPKAVGALVPILVAMAAAVAGCSGDGQMGDPDPLEEDGGATSVGSLAKPAWALRDAWTYTVNGDPATYVVTGETATDWVLETDSAERAFGDARQDVSRLGPQRKSDLAGSQGDDRVEFFQWPLTPGDAWSTRWDGEDVDIQVLAVENGVARLEARSDNGTLVYRYTYDAASRWFGELVRFLPDGAEAVRLELASSTANWTGTVVRWALDTLVSSSGTADPTLAMAETDLVVADGTTDLWLSYDFLCEGNGGFTLLVQARPPAAGGHDKNGQCTAPMHFADTIVDAPAPGTWSLSLLLGGGPTPPGYSIELLARTRTDAPVGP